MPALTRRRAAGRAGLCPAGFGCVLAGRQQHEQVIATVFPDGKLPEGWLVHLAGPNESAANANTMF